jgi:hypothetical protein
MFADDYARSAQIVPVIQQPRPPPNQNLAPRHHLFRRSSPYSTHCSLTTIFFLFLAAVPGSRVPRPGFAGAGITTEGAWGFSPTNTAHPFFSETKYAAKPRSNLLSNLLIPSPLQRPVPGHARGPVCSMQRVC